MEMGGRPGPKGTGLGIIDVRKIDFSRRHHYTDSKEDYWFRGGFDMIAAPGIISTKTSRWSDLAHPLIKHCKHLGGGLESNEWSDVMKDLH